MTRRDAREQVPLGAVTHVSAQGTRLLRASHLLAVPHCGPQSRICDDPRWICDMSRFHRRSSHIRRRRPLRCETHRPVPLLALHERPWMSDTDSPGRPRLVFVFSPDAPMRPSAPLRRPAGANRMAPVGPLPEAHPDAPHSAGRRDRVELPASVDGRWPDASAPTRRCPAVARGHHQAAEKGLNALLFISAGSSPATPSTYRSLFWKRRPRGTFGALPSTAAATERGRSCPII